ncbi:MAG: hypothetical protein DYH13_00755 [Alphaproteobacteria bacterium PRO2]|nr:hypothetical protein [Alphaproteobacteria bacterium PRO2]
MGASLATLIAVATPAWADGPPADGNTEAINPQPDKTKAAERVIIKLEKFERILGEQSAQIKAYIRSTQKQVIITIPFFQFGVVGSPHGLKDFHYTLQECFGRAAAGRQLVILTYDDKDRISMARRRYNPALSALEIVNNRPQAKKLLSIYSQAATDAANLEKEIDKLVKILRSDEANYYRLQEMEAEQKAWLEQEKRKEEEQQNLPPEQRGKTLSGEIAERRSGYEKALLPPVSDIEIYDMLFQEYLDANGSERDKELFAVINDVREAIDIAAENQEALYLDSNPWNPKSGGTPWPREATIIKVPRNHEIGIDFDNKMTIYIDDKEVIHAYSSLIINDDSRENKVVSGLGEQNLKDYKWGFLKLLEYGGKEDEVAAFRRLWIKPEPEYSI